MTSQAMTARIPGSNSIQIHGAHHLDLLLGRTRATPAPGRIFPRSRLRTLIPQSRTTSPHRSASSTSARLRSQSSFGTRRSMP
eukprot:2462090-Pyramimonas_sp.AAC.1